MTLYIFIFSLSFSLSSLTMAVAQSDLPEEDVAIASERTPDSENSPQESRYRKFIRTCKKSLRRVFCCCKRTSLEYPYSDRIIGSIKALPSIEPFKVGAICNNIAFLPEKDSFTNYTQKEPSSLDYKISVCSYIAGK